MCQGSCGTALELKGFMGKVFSLGKEGKGGVTGVDRQEMREEIKEQADVSRDPVSEFMPPADEPARGLGYGPSGCWLLRLYQVPTQCLRTVSSAHCVHLGRQ